MKHSKQTTFGKYRDYLRESISFLNPLSSGFLTLPISKRKDIPTYKVDFDVDELLKRPPVDVDFQEISAQLNGKVVLVTGGGGSIGSELCRQIIRLKPKKLLILDHSELNLYLIDSELNELRSNVPTEIILADIKDASVIYNVFDDYRPDFVYHAAAYKHVHLVEKNPYTSIMNNILGTRNLIDCALNFSVEAFVMISTDKAVNPSSIMGSTKRVCELLVTEAALKSNKRFCSVRFGNVLGSSGSLIPLLKKQVFSGGPVTITHPEMTRYFMSISEAVKLVLKAGQISRPGDVNILKMGNSVKIVDIAKQVITLMGRTVEEIPIVYIGMRPGEKLHEELYLCGNEAPTEHKDIMVLPNGDSVYNPDLFSGKDLRSVVTRLLTAAVTQDKECLQLLSRLVFMHRREKQLEEAAG